MLSELLGEKPSRLDPPHGADRSANQAEALGGSMRTVFQVAAVLVAYACLALWNAPGGYLGTDTAGKVATLAESESAGHLTLDVGYWAEQWDPVGSFHPMFGTSRVDDMWVQVTSLPMIVIGAPLYALGGYRLALLVPMLGALAAALAARRLAETLARRSDLDPRRCGDRAYWIVALGSPIALYALDFWEHSVGVALLGWAAVALLGSRVEGRSPSVLMAIGAGSLIGLAASMRTESLVHGAALFAIAVLTLLWNRRPVAAIVTGVAGVVGLAAGQLAVLGLEIWLLGEPLRAERVGGTAASGGTAVGQRFDEAIVTSLSLFPTFEATGWMAGLAVVVGVALAVGKRYGPSTRTVLLAVAVVACLVRFGDGLGFIPGALVAAPIAVVALARGWSMRAARPLMATALLAAPVVFAFQFVGGALPQWGGRYLLPATFLLVVVGAVAIEQVDASTRRVLVGLSVAITCFGLAWMNDRTTAFDRAADEVATRSEDVLLFENPHLSRELYPPGGDVRWLATAGRDELDAAAAVAITAGAETVGVVFGAGSGEPWPDVEIPGMALQSRSEMELFVGVNLRIATYNVID